MPEEIKVEEGVTDIVKAIREKVDKGLSQEEAKTILDDYIKKAAELNPPKKEEVVVKGGNLDLSQFDQDRPQTLVEIHKSESKQDHIVKAQRLMDDCLLISTHLGCRPDQTERWQSLRSYVQKSELAKAMDTATAGAGAEWIPTGFSRELVDRIREATIFPQLFEHIPMPTDPYKFPRKTSNSKAYLASENTEVTASKVGTGNNTLNAKVLKTWVPTSEDLVEASIVALLKIIKQDMVDTLSAAVDDATLNGDITDPHMDSDVTDASDNRKAWKGLRKTALGLGTTKSLATFDLQTVLQLLQKAGRYAGAGGGIKQGFWTVGSLLAVKLLNLKDEKDNPIVTTMDKLGPKATILTGQLGVLAGRPVIESEYNREDLNAAGKYDGTTKTKTVMIYTRKDAFVYGDWKSVKTEMDKDIKKGTHDLVATIKLAFEDRIPDTETIIAMGINIDPNA